METSPQGKFRSLVLPALPKFHRKGWTMQRGVLQRGRRARRYQLLCSVAVCAMAINSLAPLAAVAATATDTGAGDSKTTTPIKHVIVIIGENRTFDHVFATYAPTVKGETVLNLLSEGIVKADGTPGANYSKIATQNKANDTSAVQKVYLNSPPKTGPYPTLPAPIASGGYTDGQPPFPNIMDAQTYENGLPLGYYKYLTTGAVPGYLGGRGLSRCPRVINMWYRGFRRPSIGTGAMGAGNGASAQFERIPGGVPGRGELRGISG